MNNILILTMIMNYQLIIKSLGKQIDQLLPKQLLVNFLGQAGSIMHE